MISRGLKRTVCGHLTPLLIADRRGVESTMRKCSIAGCEKKLRIDNKSGLCKKHIRYQGTCKKCSSPMYLGRKYCQKCMKSYRSFTANIVVVCQYEGCKTIVHSKSRLCRKHCYEYYPCETPGCDRRVAFFSQYRLCDSHRNMAKKLRAVGVDVYEIKPMPIKRKRIMNKIVQ